MVQGIHRLTAIGDRLHVSRVVRSQDQRRRSRHRRRWLGLVLASAGLVACASPSIPSASTRALGPGELWLRSVPSNALCAGGGTDADTRLHGSPSDSRLAWMTLPDGTVRQLSWRPGTSARFTPNLEVIGPDGLVVAREGSVITGTCTITPDFLVADFGT
jgi:hypothetical protein